LIRPEPSRGLKAQSSAQWGRSFAENVEIGAVAENASTPTARYLTDDAQTLKVGQCGVDGGRSQPRARDEVVRGGEWMQLEQIVNTQCRTRPVAFSRDSLPILCEKFGDPHGRFESLIRGFGNAVEEEFEPRLPGAILADLLQ
jgi:hypothetical protein